MQLLDILNLNGVVIRRVPLERTVTALSDSEVVGYAGIGYSVKHANDDGSTTLTRDVPNGGMYLLTVSTHTGNLFVFDETFDDVGLGHTIESAHVNMVKKQKANKALAEGVEK